MAVESYPSYSIPVECTTGIFSSGGYTYAVQMPIVQFQAYSGSGASRTTYGSAYYQEQYQRAILIRENEYSSGMTLRLWVKYEWMGSPTPDYTVTIYSSQNLEVVDKNAYMRIAHMDGQSPSGFTDSTYSGMNNQGRTQGSFFKTGSLLFDYDASAVRDIKNVKVLCLLDCFKEARDAEEFFELIWYNPWVLIAWFNLGWEWEEWMGKSNFILEAINQ